MNGASLYRRTLHRTLTTLIVAVVSLWVAAAVAKGSGTTLYAAPGAPASGVCSSVSPCDLSFAISQAVVGDTVIVKPGTYSVSSGIVVAKAITVQGDPTLARPSLVGTLPLATNVVTASTGATLRHLALQLPTTTSVHGIAALAIDGATAEDIKAFAGAGNSQAEAILVEDSVSGTSLRTALAMSAAPAGQAILVQDSATGAGTASVVNVTAVSAATSTNTVTGNIVAGAATMRNVIATGSGTSIWRTPGTLAMNLSYSSFASTTSGAVIDGGGNSSLPPLFVNAAAGDYHEAAGSPTIATGSSSTPMSSSDLDGYAWPISSPDMGAYEFQTSSSATTTPTIPTPTSPTISTPTIPTVSTTTTPTFSSKPTAPSTTPGAPRATSSSAGQALPVASPPILGGSVTLRPASGSVSVELPGTHAFVPLARAAQVPLGTIIDTTAGVVTLTSASGRRGETKTGTFHAGRFTVSQTAGVRPQTLLRLTGGDFTGCLVAKPRIPSTRLSLLPTPVFSFTPALSIARSPNPSAHHVARQLWGSDNGGQFTTIGRSGSAAVRGTVWLTQDRCDGTLVRVLRGRVFVKPVGARHGVTVGAGHQYLARAR